MARVSNRDIRNMKPEEITNKLAELRKDLMKDNASVAVGTIPKSPGLLRYNKKLVARMNTILHEKNKTIRGK